MLDHQRLMKEHRQRGSVGTSEMKCISDEDVTPQRRKGAGLKASLTVADKISY